MPTWLKTMLFWVIVLPVMVTAMLIGVDHLRGEHIELISYVPNLLGFATGGIFVGFVMHQVKKLRENKG
ncbi:hypothetical protein [Halalkalibacterium ligniniphilum]|uniref:hypothetical protein n=1 Tax=Halalkalibacterium ligniniphilum TaxID=1134413 RepID=UPI00034DD636|nr:hypothetical protein [Halalkalibacterium ligniniphilum]